MMSVLTGKVKVSGNADRRQGIRGGVPVEEQTEQLEATELKDLRLL